MFSGMNYRAYDQLRLLGHSPEAAMQAIAEGYAPIEMYEQKDSQDSASHGGFSPVIGLKEEFKAMVILEGASNMNMPYATAYTLFKQKGMQPQEAEKAANLYQDLDFETYGAALDAVTMFSEIHSHHPEAAMRLLQNAHEVKVINFSKNFS